MHNLDARDVIFFSEPEARDRTAGFVMYIIYVEIFNFGMSIDEPFFDDFRPSRNWSKFIEKNSATWDLENVLMAKLFELVFRARVTSRKNINFVAVIFESLFLGVNRRMDATS